jgi:hypothetical protein
VSRTRSTSDGPRVSRQFLVHIDPDLIKRVKILAIDRNVTASRLVQEALSAFLAAACSPVSVSVTGDVQ